MSQSTTGNRRSPEWFDDDAFWRETYPFMFTEKRFAETPEQIRKVLKLTRPPGKSALDLCCGPGRCSVALSQRGFSVTGVDRTRYLLGKARARARAAGARVEWIQKDMRDFRRPSAYDLALSMFTSFGYFENRNDDLAVLENVFASLNPGGVFLIEMGGKEWLARHFLATTSQTLPSGAIQVAIHKIVDNWTRVRNEWIIIRGITATRFSFEHTVYLGQELRENLERVGFAGVRLYGSLDGEPYGPDAKRLIAVARKPKLRKTRRRAS